MERADPGTTAALGDEDIARMLANPYLRALAQSGIWIAPPRPTEQAPVGALADSEGGEPD